jgi:hypothetical protein
MFKKNVHLLIPQQTQPSGTLTTINGSSNAYLYTTSDQEVTLSGTQQFPCQQVDRLVLRLGGIVKKENVVRKSGIVYTIQDKTIDAMIEFT